MSSIAKSVSGAIALIETGQNIYNYVAGLMDSFEDSKESGASKKASVMLVARDFIIDLGKNWDSWAKYISDFIDAAKGIYNSLRGLIK